MLALPRRAVLAVEAVVDIAWHGVETPVRSGELTARQGIAARTLEQVLQDLVRAEILTATRGPRGGYRLARERRRISVADIVAATAPADPAEAEQLSSALGAGVVQPALQQLRQEMTALLTALTVADLCAQAARDGLPRGDAGGAGYSI